MRADSQIKFRCTLSPIQSAIKIGGDMMRISLDVALTDRPDAIGMTALEGVVLDALFTINREPLNIKIKEPSNGKPAKEKKAKAPKGEHGAYWNILCKDGLFNNRDLQTAIEAELGAAGLSDYEQGLRDVFQVTSRTFIKPIDFEQFLGRYNLAGLITKSRQAVEKAKTHLASKGEA
jgi:hypothetical protein